MMFPFVFYVIFLSFLLSCSALLPVFVLAAEPNHKAMFWNSVNILFNNSDRRNITENLDSYLKIKNPFDYCQF